MISLTDAGKRFGHKLLFQGLNWMITPQDRVGLVGANGTGKSTLLKVLADIESLDYGSINVMKGIARGYLPQDGLSLSGRTVFAECMTVFAGVQQMEEELETLTRKMSEVDHESAEYAQVAERFHRVEHEFTARDGYALESQVGAVLQGLGFRKQDWARPTEEFSGGWQMRLSLAKLLLQKPELLLLDEPTNHLDLETRNWLEEFLSNYPYAYVLISHDRYFLDVTVRKIAEIWNKGVHFYTGNYDKYLAQKQQRREQLESAYKNQRDKIEQLEAFINRFRYQATKAKQVQSRIKELERIERIEVPPEEKTIHFTFPQPRASGRMVAECTGMKKCYGENQVFGGVDFVIERGDRIALVGVNGAGKSTLIKVLAGLEPLTGGDYKLGHNVDVDYFAQDQYKELDTDARVLDDIGRVAQRATETELRNLLGCFLFTEDDVFKRIGVLSGGERNRYALARMLLHPSNFLLLDEPTNHLDLRAKDVLLESLAKFTGTVVFVSHDRYFIDKLATRVFEVGGGEVHVFPGNYEDYLYRKQKAGEVEELAAKKSDSPKRAAPSAARQLTEPIAVITYDGTGGESEAAEVASPAASNGGSAPKARRLNPIKLQQLKKRLPQIEEEISRLEAGIAHTETSLQSFESAEETKRLTELLATYRSDLAQMMEEWEQVSEEIEANR